MTRSACVLLSILCSPVSSWQKSSFKLLTNDSSGHRAAGLIFFSRFYWDGGLASVLGRISLYPLRVFPIARDVQSTCAVMEISCYSKASVGNKETIPQLSRFGSFLQKSGSILVMGCNSVYGIKIKDCFIWFRRCIFSHSLVVASQEFRVELQFMLTDWLWSWGTHCFFKVQCWWCGQSRAQHLELQLCSCSVWTGVLAAPRWAWTTRVGSRSFSCQLCLQAKPPKQIQPFQL